MKRKVAKTNKTRCCVMFASGKRCRYERAEGSSWCEKHKPIMDGLLNQYNKMAEEGLDYEDKS